MSTLKRAWARLSALFRARGLDGEFNEEIASHIDLATEDYLRRGLSPAEARRRARVQFGSEAASRDLHRDARGLPWVDGLIYDMRHAIRGLMRDRGFTLTAIVMLTVALALNVAVFTIRNTMLFGGFPFVQQNDRLVYLFERNALSNNGRISYADVEDWKKQAKSFQGMALVRTKATTLSRSGSERGANVWAMEVGTNAFSLLGAKPVLGRDFTAADEAPGAEPVLILNHHFWETQMGKRSDVIGSRVWLNKVPATVVGAMAEDFEFPENGFDFWLPLAHTPELLDRTSSGWLAFGRLKDGATFENARTELLTIGKRLEAEYPATNAHFVPIVETFTERFIGRDAPMIYGSLWAAAGLVLLIACANLANLTLARTLGRSRELSTRIALGAGQGRMIRQVLAESVILAGISGLLAWWAAGQSLRIYETAAASPMHQWTYSMDGGALVYLIVVAVAAALLFSIVPVLRVLHLDVNHTLKGDGRGNTQGARAKVLSGVLVAGQMALAIVLLAGAGVFVRSFLRVVNADSGARDVEHVLTAMLILPEDKYPGAEASMRYLDRLKARLEAIPGADVASAADMRLTGWPANEPVEFDDRATTGRAEDLPTALSTLVASDYFRVVGATMRSGREFNEGDRLPGMRPAIVNERFAQLFWPGKDPVGQRIRVYDAGKPGEPARPGDWRTVVGVTSNLMMGDPLKQEFLPVVYQPVQRRSGLFLHPTLFLRTRLPAERLLAAVRNALAEVDPDVGFRDLETLQQSFRFRPNQIDGAHQDMAKNAALAPILAAIALLLAAIGLYAVIAHSVGQRTKEIGVRMAVGAMASEIRKMVFREGMAPVAVGLLLGLAASLGVNRILQSQLVVSPYDPVTLIGAAVVLMLVALLGCHIPARRAIRVDPVVALRQD